MQDIRHYWNGQLIDPPRNWEAIKLLQDWDERKEGAYVKIDNLEFTNDAAKQLRERIENGILGGVGVFEGDPYTIEIGPQGSPIYTFEGYLDFADKANFIGCHSVQVALKKKKGIDWLNDVADSFSFASMEDEGIISESDYIKVPYVINYVPDNMQLVMLSMSIYMMTKELIEQIRDISAAITEVIQASTPNTGIPPSIDTGDLIAAILKTAARIAYAVAIVIAIKNLIGELLEQLLPKKRFHLGMSIKTLIEKGGEKLGLQIESEFLDDRSNWVLIPSKNHKGGEPQQGTERGHPNNTDSVYTFGNMIRTLKDMFNADINLTEDTLEFERWDKFNSSSGYVIPDTFTDQENAKDDINWNTDELTSNYNINWAYDIQDQNTLDDQEGRVFQVITEPNTVNNQEFVNIKGLKEVAIPFTAGLRKNELTRVEKIAKVLGGIVDNITGIFGNGTSFAAQIDARIGALLLSSHFTTFPKMVVMTGNQLSINQKSILSAKKLWEDFHYINSFVEINSIHNQFKLYNKVKVPFCFEDFILLSESNEVLTADGRLAYIDNLEWTIVDKNALISYRIREKYTNNLKQRFLE